MNTSNNAIALQRKSIRARMRERRRNLNPLQQKKAAIALSNNLKKIFGSKRFQHIALYLPSDGEIDPSVFIKNLWHTKKRVVLPVLHPIKKNQLWFVQYNPHTHLHKNRFGISEPDIKNTKKISPKALSLVLLPLVSFDEQGERLGMGGGFYDRTFAFTREKWKQKAGNRRFPVLCGLAHEFQKTESLPAQPWDIPLEAVVTEANIYWIQRKERKQEKLICRSGLAEQQQQPDC